MRPQHPLGGFDRLIDPPELQGELGDREPPADALRRALDRCAIELERGAPIGANESPGAGGERVGSVVLGAASARQFAGIAQLAGRKTPAPPG